MAVDAVVIGAGHNGLVAATMLARAGWRVEVLEQSEVAGGAIGSDRTALGYLHDWGSAFYGVLHESPVFGELGLDRRVAWASTPSPVACLWEPGTPAAVMAAAPEQTCDGLGIDGPAWSELVAWWQRAGARLLGGLTGPYTDPRPMLAFAAKEGLRGSLASVRTLLEPVEAFVAHRFSQMPARMLFASNATHADQAIDACGSTPPAMLLAMAAQTRGMPVPVGGASALAGGFVEAAVEAGVVIRLGRRVERVVVRGGRAVGVVCADGSGIGVRKAVVADVPPDALARDLVGEQHLPGAWLRQLRRHRWTSGYFRLDLDLSAPAPWQDARLAEAMVVHLTGDFDELALSQAQVRRDRLPEKPQIILGQQDRADPSRVPTGTASLWAECHCPARPVDAGTGWEESFADAMTARLATHAPGLPELVVDRTVTPPLALQARDPNLVGGDVGGGATSLDQLSVLRPIAGWSSYALPLRGLYMCGAASHPGGGVHGQVGRNAARTVLRDHRLRLTHLKPG